MNEDTKNTEGEEDTSAMTAPARTLRTFSLVTVTFFCTAGGPYGLETIVPASNPLYSLLALTIFPWLWSFPIAMVTAELSGIIPSNEGVGYVVWIEKAFGKYFSFLAGYWSCVCNLLDKAIYPVLFLDYLNVIVGDTLPLATRVLIALLLVLLVVAMNLRGMDIVGGMSIVFFVMTLLPFVIFSVLAIPEIDPTLWFKVGTGKVDWTLFISLLMWNNSGWDSVGFLAGETINPRRTFPKAMVISVFLVTATYVFPLMVAICVNKNWSKWENGSFQIFASQVGGNGLMFFFILGAAFCCIGIFNALLSTTSRLMYSMSKMGMLPQIFGRIHPRWGTPWFAICFNGVVISMCILLPFKELLETSVITNAAVIAGILLSFLVIRIKSLGSKDVKEDDVFRLPIRTGWLCIYFLIPLSLCAYSILYANPLAHYFTLGLLITGTIFYLYYQKVTFSSLLTTLRLEWLLFKRRRIIDLSKKGELNI